jgi:cyclophilin family peptidyl-prolyl cis-trans isomerase
MKRLSIAVMTLLAASVLAMAAVSAPVPAAAKPKPLDKPVKLAASTDKAIAAIDAQIAAAKVDKKAPGWKQHLPQPKAVAFDPAKKYYAHMTTNVGTMVIEFKPKIAPMHVTNFIYLSRLGFYDGLKFHRVIKGFMAQGGDPAGNGTGGPGYQYAGEVSPSAKHDQIGVLSTANAGPDTDGSQFFLMFRAYPSLDMKYSIFGQVVEGMDVVKALEDAGNPNDGPPLRPLTITSVTIDAK